jgi:hypothetical protein
VSGAVWISLGATFAVIATLVLVYQTVGVTLDRWNSTLLRYFLPVRVGWVTTLMLHINGLLASRWLVAALRLGTIATLVGFRRWRHLFTFGGSVIAVVVVVYELTIYLAAGRPLSISIIGPWSGFSTPSRPVAALAVTFVGMVYSLLPHGRPRSIGKWSLGPY